MRRNSSEEERHVGAVLTKLRLAEAELLALREVEKAARARFGEWTRETYVALEKALAALDVVRSAHGEKP